MAVVVIGVAVLSGFRTVGLIVGDVVKGFGIVGIVGRGVVISALVVEMETETEIEWGFSKCWFDTLMLEIDSVFLVLEAEQRRKPNWTNTKQ